MQVETTSDADRECKDLIGEAYEAAYKQYPDFGGFSGLDDLWDKVQEVLDRKGTLDLCTTGAEDSEAQDILEEVFGEACQTAKEEDSPTYAFEYVDYQKLWERICAVLEVSV